jgi:hypothetical protein
MEDVIRERTEVNFTDGADKFGDTWLSGVGGDGKCSMDGVVIGYERRSVVNVRDDG